MKQMDRVLALLRARGSAGITPVDFAAPHVADGGTPIMRLAARVKDLRDEGYHIESGMEANGVARYTLQRALEATQDTGCSSLGGNAPASPRTSDGALAAVLGSPGAQERGGAGAPPARSPAPASLRAPADDDWIDEFREYRQAAA